MKYPVLPKPAEGEALYNEGQMHAFVDEDRKARTKAHDDFAESVGKMLDAIGYTEEYALQWPDQKVSVTFKQWFDEQLEFARNSRVELPVKNADLKSFKAALEVLQPEEIKGLATSLFIQRRTLESLQSTLSDSSKLAQMELELYDLRKKVKIPKEKQGLWDFLKAWVRR